MKDASIHVAKHSVLQTVAIQQGTELGDEVREILRRNSRVLDERLRPGLPLDIAQEANRALAHRIDPFDCLVADCQGVPQAMGTAIGLEVLYEIMDALLQLRPVVAAEFDQVDS
ncbi:hypothetical protein D9M68_871690 [compost metagenome]